MTGRDLSSVISSKNRIPMDSGLDEQTIAVSSVQPPMEIPVTRWWLFAAFSVRRLARVVLFTATNSDGAQCSGMVKVSVPHDKKDPAIEGPQLYNSFGL